MESFETYATYTCNDEDGADDVKIIGEMEKQPFEKFPQILRLQFPGSNPLLLMILMENVNDNDDDHDENVNGADDNDRIWWRCGLFYEKPKTRSEAQPLRPQFENRI